MFQSIRGVSGQSSEASEHPHYTFLIVDSDFGSEEWSDTWGCGAVIKCYSSKKLNVAFNLYLHHRYLDLHIPELIAHFYVSVPAYKYYAEQVKRYHERYNKMKVFW